MSRRLTLAAWLAAVGAASLMRPVTIANYFINTVILTGLLAAAGLLMQRVRVAGWAQLVLMMLTSAVTVIVAYYHSTFSDGLPTTATWVESGVDWRRVAYGLHSYAPPLPDRREFSVAALCVCLVLFLLLYAFVVLLRQPAGAGMVLLLAYTIPAATVAGGISVFWFVPPAIGFFLVLWADASLRHQQFGPPVDADHETRMVPGSAKAAQWIVVGSLVAAIGLTGLVPDLGNGFLKLDRIGSGIGGLASRPNTAKPSDPVLDVARHLRQRQNTVALTYSGPAQVLLRSVALEEFDGTRWRLGTRPAGQPATTDVTFDPPTPVSDPDQLLTGQYQVRLGNHPLGSWLPLPYPTKMVSGLRGPWLSWAATHDIQAGSSIRAGSSFNVEAYRYALDSSAFGVGAGEAANEAATRLPGGHDALLNRMRGLVNQINTRARASTPLQQAVAMQNYFANNPRFRYDVTDDDNTGMNAIGDFLFNTRSGYCVQYAASMALLARVQGIPSRVATGFQPGRRVGREYQVMFTDAHAWPELYFEGAGWVRFEPTPGQYAGDTSSYSSGLPTPTADPTEDENDPVARPSATPGTPAQSEPSAATPTASPTSQAPEPVRHSGWGVVATIAAIGAGLLALGAIPAGVRVLRRRRRLFSDSVTVESAYDEVRDTARDLGWRWPNGATPRQVGVWLTEQFVGEPATEVAALIRAVEVARYAPPRESATVGAGAAAAAGATSRAAGGASSTARDSADPGAAQDGSAAPDTGASGAGVEAARALVTRMRSQVSARTRWKADLLPRTLRDRDH